MFDIDRYRFFAAILAAEEQIMFIMENLGFRWYPNSRSPSVRKLYDPKQRSVQLITDKDIPHALTGPWGTISFLNGYSKGAFPVEILREKIGEEFDANETKKLVSSVFFPCGPEYRLSKVGTYIFREPTEISFDNKRPGELAREWKLYGAIYFRLSGEFWVPDEANEFLRSPNFDESLPKSTRGPIG